MSQTGMTESIDLLSRRPGDFYIEFRAVDRFLYRISDLYELESYVREDLLQRLDQCHIYLIGKRPRLTLVPDSIEVDENVSFKVEYSVKGAKQQASIQIPRSHFHPDEVVFEASSYPHRELITRAADGSIVGYTLLATMAHVMPNVKQEAQDLEIVYIGKGLRFSAQDRLQNHTTLQRILAEINSNDLDSEVFALVYSFKYLKNVLMLAGNQPDLSEAARQKRKATLQYRPTLEEQVSLTEAALISYFQPVYNTQYLDFPSRKHRLLSNVFKTDVAAIVVQIDNVFIGDLKIYSSTIRPDTTHHYVVDLRSLDGGQSLLSQLPSERKRQV